MCTPAKRPKTGTDVLDLSHKDSVDPPKNAADVIVLSEDDEEKVTPSSSDTEKENAPCSTNGRDGLAEIYRVENELRQEEATLLLLQKIRENQKSAEGTVASGNVKPVTPAQTPTSNNNVSVVQKCSGNQTPQRPPSVTQPAKVASPTMPQTGSPLPTPKFTKQAALQSLEQLFASKKAANRKQLDRNLEKVSLPRPTTGTGLCEIAFIPSTATSDFTSLLGLEEVVKAIQDYDSASNGVSTELRCSFNPFTCVKCGTDFTPVWKREKQGSSNVVCETCLINTQKVTLKKEYEDAVQRVTQHHIASEREIDREYHDIVNTPAKLEAYIKDQEKILLTAQQAQMHIAQQAAYNQRYNKAAVNSTPSAMRQSPSTVVSGTSVAAAAHQRSRVAATGGNSAAGVGSPAVTPASAQAALIAQIALEQYAKSMGSPNNAASGANAALMMAAVAKSQQQAAAAAVLQQQQRLAAAHLLSGFQSQAAAAQQSSAAASSATATSSDQAAGTLAQQIQALFMGGALLGGGAAAQGSGTREQLIQQAMQYILLQQQQQAQQQAAAQAAQAAAAQAAQQNAVLSHFLAQFQSNPTTYFNLMQLWVASNMNNSNNAGGGNSGSGGSAPPKK